MLHHGVLMCLRGQTVRRSLGFGFRGIFRREVVQHAKGHMLLNLFVGACSGHLVSYTQIFYDESTADVMSPVLASVRISTYGPATAAP